MPSNQTPLGALPARFRRPSLLIVGCGDVGQRVARDILQTKRRMRVLALTSNPESAGTLRAMGVIPLSGNLDNPATLRRLAGLAMRVLHLAPPPSQGAGTDAGGGWHDPRTTALVRALRLGSTPLALVYGSTSGVYGDCGGAHITETRAVAPATPRAYRRVDAERTLRDWGRAGGIGVSILRIPGIYAPDREGGTPEARLRRGTPVLAAPDDVFTNHIHADDLARICARALWRGAAQRIYHANDNSQLKMGDYFDQAADLYGLPRPPRLSRSEAQAQLPPMLLSFMSESRRMDNTRLHRELGVCLRYPTVLEGLSLLAPL